MASRKGAKPRLVACKKCGAIVTRDTGVCPVCGSTDFSESWEGLIIVIKEDSSIAKKLSIEKPGLYAVKVAGRVVTR